MLNEKLINWETENMNNMTVYCALSMLIILIGIPANSLSLSFFILREETKISKMIFIWLNSVDLFVCIWMIPQAILNYSFGEIELFKTRLYCSIRLATYPSSLQLSIFITQLLCLTRTYSLVRPLVVLKRRYVTMAMVVFILVIFGRVTQLFLSDAFTVKYSERRLRCTWMRTALANTAVFNTWNIFLSCCMLIPTFVGCTTAIVLLYRNKKNPHSKTNPMTQIKRDANITVVIITIVCLIGYIQFIAMTFISRIAGSASVFLDNLSLIYACSAVSAINPVIYFVRIKRLRHHAYFVYRNALSLLKLKPRLPERLHSSRDIIRINLPSISNGKMSKPEPVQRNNTVVVALPESSDDEGDRNGSLGKRAIVINTGFFPQKPFERKPSVRMNFLNIIAGTKKGTNDGLESIGEAQNLKISNKNDATNKNQTTYQKHNENETTNVLQNANDNPQSGNEALPKEDTVNSSSPGDVPKKRLSRVDFVLNFPCDPKDMLEFENNGSVVQHETYLH